MDYINGGARDIGRRKEVRFLSYLQGIPSVQAYVRARACVACVVRFVVEGSFVRKRTGSVRILMTTVPPLFISSSIRYNRRSRPAVRTTRNHRSSSRDNSYVLIVDFTSGCRLRRATCACASRVRTRPGGFENVSPFCFPYIIIRTTFVSKNVPRAWSVNHALETSVNSVRWDCNEIILRFLLRKTVLNTKLLLKMRTNFLQLDWPESIVIIL